MFKPFNLNYRELPSINIKIWEGCPAACTDCKFSINYIKWINKFSLDNILNRMKIVDEKCDKSFNFAFWNCDWLDHDNIVKILWEWLKTGREVIFQIWFKIRKEHFLLFEKIEKEFWYEKISLKIAQNCRGLDNLNEKIFVLIKLLNNKCRFGVYLDLFLDFDNNKNLISFFSKKFYDKNWEYWFCFNISDNIELKFHNYSWYYDKIKKCLINLEREECQQLDQLMIKDNNIYLKDSLDVYENWDLFMHDNLCNIWDIRISNIFLDNEVIYNNFNIYLNYLENLKKYSSNQSDMCYKCVTNWYKYINN